MAVTDIIPLKIKLHLQRGVAGLLLKADRFNMHGGKHLGLLIEKSMARLLSDINLAKVSFF